MKLMIEGSKQKLRIHNILVRCSDSFLIKEYSSCYPSETLVETKLVA